MTAKNRKAFASLDFDIDLGGPFSFSDHDSGQVIFSSSLLPIVAYKPLIVVNWRFILLQS
jgi:hypothetical protein